MSQENAPQPPLKAVLNSSRDFPIAKVLGLMILAGLAGVLAPMVIRFIEFRTGNSITDDAFLEAQMVHVAPNGVSGRIIRVAVREDDYVKKGQILLELDSDQYKDQVAMAEAKLQMAQTEGRRQEISLDKLRKEIPLSIAISKQTLQLAKIEQAKMERILKLTTDEIAGGINESEALLGVAQANRTLAQLEFDRFNTLYQENAATLRRTQEVTRTNESTKAELRLAEAKRGKSWAAQTQVDVARKDYEAATTATEKAILAVAFAETQTESILEAEQLLLVRQQAITESKTLLHTARHHLENTRIVSPISGCVVKRMKNTGDHVTMGLPLLTLYDPDLIFVTANLEETRLAGVKPGNIAEVKVDALGRSVRGRVLWMNRSTGSEFSLLPRNVVSGEFTKVVQRVPIRIVLDPDQDLTDLRAGYSTRVIIAHGPGDPEWTRSALAESRLLDTRFDEAPEQSEGKTP
ncbi:MAG: HlyD family secretion protein [Planctomycetota bacterium]|nr:HlyD family secretion protein [Planctomycetota bacterium]